VKSEGGLRVSVIIRDVTERKQTEQKIHAIKETFTRELSATNQELELRNREVERANRLKSEFLASMSHELRTPLTSILGYSELLQMRVYDHGHTDISADIERIQSAGKHLLALISDILDISKIEAGKLDLYLETFDVPTLVGYVASTVRPLVERNGNTLEIICPEDLGAMHSDMTRVQQILFNLLSNAAKFTERGSITFTVTRESENDDWFVFRVADTGIGLTPEQIGNLFNEFIQAEASTTRKYGGTGLGLALSGRFCQMMGGTIGVESQVGEGSIFTARIPAVVRDPNATSGDQRLDKVIGNR
jgi:signal transduction histidine kinase